MAVQQKATKRRKSKPLDFTAKIRKWGNSYAIHLPKEVLDSYGLKEGDRVRIPRIHKDKDLEKIRGIIKDSKIASERDIEE